MANALAVLQAAWLVQLLVACCVSTQRVSVWPAVLHAPTGGSDEGGGGAADARESGRSQQFISAVCWRPGSYDLLVANSHGSLKLMQLTAAGSGR